MPVYPRELTQSMREDEKRGAEIFLYDLLREKFPPGYTAIYNAEWACSFDKVREHNLVDPLNGEAPGPGTYPLGEVDFLLVTPRCLLIVEVKGGLMSVEGGTWYRTGRNGLKQAVDCPLAQARRNMFAVCGTLKNGWRYYRRFIPTGYAVVLPHTPAWSQGGSLQHWQKLILFQEHAGESIMDRLEETLTFWGDLWKDYTGRQETLTEVDRKHIISVCATTTRISKPRLRQAIQEFQGQILKVTESQYGILRGLSSNRRAVITGGAGTGKTLLAMEKARQMALQGQWTLFTCANRLLSQHVKDHLQEVENLEVMNFHELCFNWGLKAGIPDLKDPDGPEGNELPQEYFQDTLPEVLFEAAQILTHRYDAVIVDEAQDMHEVYWTALQCCLKEDAPIFYIFCDPGQSIWNLRDTLPFDQPSFGLSENLRNSKKIFAALKHLSSRPDYEGGCSREGELKILPLKGPKNLERRLQALLLKLVQEGVQPRDIVILTGRSREQSRLAQKKKLGQFPLTRDLQATENQVLFSSVRQFRGMESAVVVMVEVDAIVDLAKLRQELEDRLDLLPDDDRLETIAKETLAIGMSRAQHSLYILADAATARHLKALGVGQGDRDLVPKLSGRIPSTSEPKT